MSTSNLILILSAHCEINNWSDEIIESEIKSNNSVIFGKQVPIYLGKKITPRYLWSHFDDIKRKNYYSDLEKRYFCIMLLQFMIKTF